MSTDIGLIRNALQNCEEITLPCDLKKNCILKYITLKDGNEAFYQGGHFKHMGNQKIFLSNGNKTWSVPIKMFTKDGKVLYKPRFFIEKETSECSDDIKELNTIISTQQSVIEKMTKQIKYKEIEKQKYKQKHDTYEKLLQDQRYEIKDKDLLLKQQEQRMKDYESLIRKLQYYYQSHPLNHKK
jgi:hypothetical protein